MRNSAFLTILLVLFVPTRSFPGVNTIGVDYVIESNVLVYGGSRFYSRSQIQEDIRTLYMERLGSNSRDVLHQAEGSLNDIKAVPQGALVGVLEVVLEENVSEERATFVDRRYDENGDLIASYYFEDSRLLILNLDGAILGSISRVRRYTWSPDGRRIAYITGSYYEGGYGFKTTGTWIYDLSSGQVERIHSGGSDVQWASWDGNIYIYDRFNEDAPDTRVFRFDPDTKQLASTSHQGIYFSPVGDYYYTQGGGVPLRIFETETDSEVPADLSIESADRMRDPIAARGWLDKRILIVPSPDPNEDGDYLYNIETGKLRYAPGAVLPERGSDDGVLILEGTSVIERTVDEFEVVQ